LPDSRPEAARSGIYLEHLDGFRTLAFLAVFANHCLAPVVATLDLGTGVVGLLGHVAVSQGETAVGFFFVLSGFLITYLLIVEQRTHGRIDLARFYARRTLRIWPLYFFVLAIVFIIIPSALALLRLPPRVLNEHAPWYWVFLSNFDQLRVHIAGLRAEPTLSLTWSIAVEEQFYLTWGLLAAVLAPGRWPWVFSLLFAASVGFKLMHWPDRWTLWVHTLSVTYDLVCGSAAAWWSMQRPQVRDFIGALPPAVSVGLPVGVLALLSADGWIVPHPLTRLVLPILFAGILLEQTFGRRSAYKMGRRRALTALGRYTYGMYLLHHLAYAPLATTLSLGTSGRLAAGVLALPVTIGLAWLSYHYLEAPFLRLKDRLTPPRAVSGIAR
jgi:peptidoglycan/LPS O-acetylase OafA/YrhL